MISQKILITFILKDIVRSVENKFSVYSFRVTSDGSSSKHGSYRFTRGIEGSGEITMVVSKIYLKGLQIRYVQVGFQHINK